MPNTLLSFTGQTLPLFERQYWIKVRGPWVHAPSFIYLKEKKQTSNYTQDNVMEIMFISTLKHRE